jgi:arylsulfatase B
MKALFTKTGLLIVACILGISSQTTLAHAKEQSQQKPNIVIVLTDDQGYGDLGVHGNPIVKTPAIDSLAKESVSLTNYHVAPTCAPTRAGLLTGRWNNRTGVWHTIMGRSMLRENEKTMADLLKANGYQTAMFGKWHLGDNYPYRPHDRGFDHAYYHGGGGVGQTPDHWDNAYFDDVYSRNDIKEQASGFVTDVLFDEAIAYIETAKENKKPFFTYISTNAPHSPMHAPQHYADMYANQKLPIKLQHFFGMITNIDDNVAKLRNYLAKENLTDNTIFIFTTDNGTSTGGTVFNAGMKGYKNSEYDGGHRVPFFIHWPKGKLAHGTKQQFITSFVDVVPTLLSLTKSTKTLNVEFDGVSLNNLVKGNTQGLENRIIFTDSQRVLTPKKWRKSAVMTNKWRLINGKKLYDIQTDPSQAHNVAAQHPETVNNLRTAYDNWWDDIAKSFAEPTRIFIGDEQSTSVQLTAHDWLGDNAKVPWNQKSIRGAVQEKDGVHKGYWALKVVQSGTYQITLRRWPKELDLAISAPLSSGKPSTGQRAFREAKGRAFKAVKAKISIEETALSTQVDPDDKSVSFTIKLNKGKAQLSASFVNQDNQELGAYYVQVDRVQVDKVN